MNRPDPPSVLRSSLGLPIGNAPPAFTSSSPEKLGNQSLGPQPTPKTRPIFSQSQSIAGIRHWNRDGSRTHHCRQVGGAADEAGKGTAAAQKSHNRPAQEDLFFMGWRSLLEPQFLVLQEWPPFTHLLTPGLPPPTFPPTGMPTALRTDWFLEL